MRDASGSVLVKTPNLKPGDQARLKLDLPPGSYVDYCQEPGHESLGMKGALTVR
ncbi:MAG: plastocyanin/azurin family copper-binding protein [Candidatus Dormibacteraeota bacterium]|nr:plastocyanin/azurin family copper-binding protein [Candidatus Dormibacteraeota bacterium]